MLTLKLKISNLDDIKDKLEPLIYQYTGLFYKLFKHQDLFQNDKMETISNKFDLLGNFIIDCCKTDVKTKIAQIETFKQQQYGKIQAIEKELQAIETSNKTKKNKKIQYRLKNKLASLNKSIFNGIVFGTRSLLKKISYYKNTNQIEKYEETKKEFQIKRSIPIYLIGQADSFGNRKFNFDLFNKKMIFKPSKDNHIEIKFDCSKNQQKVLNEIQKMSDLKLMPISVRVSNEYVYLMYDEIKLTNYGFNEKECKKEQKIFKNDKEMLKQIYIKYKNEQQDRMLKDKISNRYMSVDLNPYEIGLSIVDSNPDGTFKIIKKYLYDLSKYHVKLNKSSSDKIQKYQNNKRKYEIKQVWKHIFNLCKHYRVAHFVLEELDFKDKTINKNDKNLNRSSKNYWHLGLTKNLITKYCNILGIQKIEVNPVYSSFIGNMVYPDYDCISSSLELVRRGINKYIKGAKLFPEIDLINQDKMSYVFGENVSILGEDLTWVGLYNLASNLGLRYRTKSKKLFLEDIFMNSYKSEIRIYM